MARPREFDPDQVLQTAINLFWDKGYFDSSVDEIVRQSGVAKYGIYGTFGSKHELFMKALNQYASERHRDIQGPLRKPGAALPNIRQFFENAVELMTGENAPRGCLIVNTGVELGLRDAGIRDFVAEFFLETETVMERCLSNAVALGQIADPSDVASLAKYLVIEYRTALMLASSGCPRRDIANHLKMALKLLS